MANYKSIGRMISSINRYQQIYLNSTLKDLGLHGSGQVRIVMVLSREKDGISQDDLSSILMIDKASVSRMVRPLVQNGIVNRKQNPLDRRAYILTLSESAAEKLPFIKKTLKQWTGILSKGMSGKELEMLYTLLEKAELNARNFPEGDHG